MPRKKKSTTTAGRSSSKNIDWAKRAAKIRKFRSLPTRARENFSAQDKKTISRLWDKYKWMRAENVRKVGRKARHQLKQAGFDVEEKGAIIERMTGAGDTKIPGARLTVSKTGAVVQSTKNRKDYYVAINGDQRRRFIFDPEGYVNKQSKKNKIPKRRWVHLVVNGKSWGRMTSSGAMQKLQSFRSKDIAEYDKSTIALKFVSFTETQNKKGRKKS